MRIYDAVSKARALKAKWKDMAFRHTERRYNQVADDMARRALELKSQVIFWDGSVPEDAPDN